MDKPHEGAELFAILIIVTCIASGLFLVAGLVTASVNLVAAAVIVAFAGTFLSAFVAFIYSALSE